MLYYEKLWRNILIFCFMQCWISILICLCLDLNFASKQAWETESINELFGWKYRFVAIIPVLIWCVILLPYKDGLLFGVLV